MLKSLTNSLKKAFLDPVFNKKKAFLRSLPIFKDLKERDLGYLLQAFHTRRYHESEVLFMENDIGRALFVLETGKVELTKLDAQGRPKRLALLGPGDFFGEMALLEQLPRSATAVALEDSHVYLLYRSRLEDLLASHATIGVSIMRHLASLLSARLRRATQYDTLGQAPPAGAKEEHVL